MRRAFACQKDDNQDVVVAALRSVGATVTITARAGDGFPDLCVGYRGANYLLEVKDPAKDIAHQRLTPKQVTWHAKWRGQKAVVKTRDDALRAIGAIA